MTTKADLIAQLKAENPKMTATINDEQIELNAEEYEKACNDWAEMRLEQIKLEEAETKAKADKEATSAKLVALGLTADNLKALGL